MTQEAANVIDLNAYRTRRGQHSPPAPRMFSDFAQAGWVLAVPVLMPVAHRMVSDLEHGLGSR